jgi:hypothetical protein
MKVTNDNLTLREFKAWSGAKDTQKTILNEGKGEEFDSLIEELYPDGIEETQLNDLLWFSDEFIYEMLGIADEEEE